MPARNLIKAALLFCAAASVLSLTGPLSDSLIGLFLLALVSVQLLARGQQHGPRADHSRLKTLPLQTLLLAGGVLALGLLSGQDKIIMLAAILLMCCGMTIGHHYSLRSHSLAILVLFLALPPPASIAAFITTLLAAGEAQLAASLLRLLDTPVTQIGAQLSVGDRVISVNRDCTGLSLLAPVMMGAVVAATSAEWGTRSALQKGAFPLRTKAARAMLLIACAPLIALLLNSLRIMTLVLLAAAGFDQAFTIVHDSSGLLLMATAWLLPFGLVSLRHIPRVELQHLKRPVLASMMLFAVPPALSHAAEPSLKETKLPFYHRGWVSEEARLSAEEKTILAAQATTRRHYRKRTDGPEVIVTAMFFSSAQKARAHNSKSCFEALGWQTQVLNQSTLADGTEMQALVVRSLMGRQKVHEFLVETEIGVARLQIVTPYIAPQGMAAWIRDYLYRFRRGEGNWS